MAGPKQILTWLQVGLLDRGYLDVVGDPRKKAIDLANEKVNRAERAERELRKTGQLSLEYGE